MGYEYYVLHDNIQIIAADGSKFVQEEFVMNIFDILANKLPTNEYHLQ